MFHFNSFYYRTLRTLWNDEMLWKVLKEVVDFLKKLGTLVNITNVPLHFFFSLGPYFPDKSYEPDLGNKVNRGSKFFFFYFPCRKCQTKVMTYELDFGNKVNRGIEFFFFVFLEKFLTFFFFFFFVVCD